jgi:hypothetical protein
MFPALNFLGLNLPGVKNLWSTELGKTGGGEPQGSLLDRQSLWWLEEKVQESD